jgi:hypothetical protein
MDVGPINPVSLPDSNLEPPDPEQVSLYLDTLTSLSPGAPDPSTAAAATSTLDQGLLREHAPDSAAQARTAYSQSVEMFTAETLATDAEAAFLMQNQPPPPPAVPGALEASQLLTSGGPGTPMAILGGGLLGFWPGPTPEVLEAFSAHDLRETEGTTVQRTTATPKTGPGPGHSGDTEAAMVAYQQQEKPPKAGAAHPHLDILD